MRCIPIAGSMFLFFCVTLSCRASAESPAQSQLNQVLETIESSILQGNVVPSVVGKGACAPTLQFGYPTLTLKWPGGADCSMSGDMRFTVSPFSASVHLVLNQSKYIQNVDIEYNMSLKKTSEGNREFIWKVAEGHVGYRTGADQPLNSWMVTGQGSRVSGKSSLTVNSRVNFFDKATGNGTVIIKSLTQAKPGSKSSQVQSCTLMGAVAGDPVSGTLSNCANLR